MNCYFSGSNRQNCVNCVKIPSSAQYLIVLYIETWNGDKYSLQFKTSIKLYKLAIYNEVKNEVALVSSLKYAVTWIFYKKFSRLFWAQAKVSTNMVHKCSIIINVWVITFFRIEMVHLMHNKSDVTVEWCKITYRYISFAFCISRGTLFQL